MARPTGWDILGLDGDPTPGVVESVQALAKQFGDFAHDAEAAYRSLNSFGSDAQALNWVGQTAEAFKGQFGPLPGRLQKLYTSYSEASDALSAYAPALQAAQSKADAALRQAQDAHADLQRATTNANTAATDLKTAQQNQAASPNQQAVTDAQTAHDTAQNSLNSAKARMADLSRQAHDAYNDRIHAAQECAKALGHAQHDGIHNKHWWEHVGEFMSEWGGKIAEIANDLAPFLDVLALATSWIPGVDVITAGLAEADNIIALIGTGMEVAGDAMQGHWGDALMGVGMLGLQFAGGKLLGKLGKEAEEGESTVGSEVREGEGVERSVCETDPVDVVSGQMLTAETDLDLQAVLPIVLRRVYASGYTTGRLFGPGWASTLDQRLAVNAAGVHFAGDDGQTLHYPIPAAGAESLPARGARWPLTWDHDADEIRIHDPWSGLTRHFQAVHHRDEIGQIRDLTAISDRNGNRISVTRDEVGTPTAVETAAYRIAIDSAATAAGPRVTGIRLQDRTGPNVTIRTFHYDNLGRLTGVVDSSGIPYSYQYDTANRICGWTDRVGYGYRYEYDDRGRTIRTLGDDGLMSGTFVFDDAERTTVFINSQGGTTTYRYDESGHVTAVTDALGHTTLTTYDRHGLLLTRTDPTGARTACERDEHGDLLRFTAPDGAVSEFTYNAFHQIVTADLPGGIRWRRDYDEQGNLVSTTDPLGAVRTFTYAAGGVLTGVRDPGGVTVEWASDAAGLVLASRDSFGAVAHVERDLFGRVTSLTDPTGARTEYGWTTEGRPAWQTLPDGARTAWTYDAEGRLVETTDPVGARTLFEPGPFAMILARTGPDGIRHSFQYDSELRLTSVTNPAGATWSYQYDATGRLVGETDFIGRTQSYAHDPAGRLTVRTTGLGQQIVLERDAGGRVVGRQTPDGAYRYLYDPAGYLVAASGPGTKIQIARDAMGRVLAETVDGRTTTFGYDVAGRQIARTTASGTTSTWEYDAAGRPIALQAGGERLAFGYDDAGRHVESLLGSGARLALDYDATGRQTAQRLFAPGSGGAAGAGGDGSRDTGRAVLERDWTWRADGVPIEVRDTVRGRRSITSDPAGRVTGISGRDWHESYSYDSFGNLTFAEGTAGADDDAAGRRDYDRTLVRAAGRTTYEHDAAGRLIRTVRRTLDGRRRIWTYEWDAEDRLTAVSTPDGARWRYTYDPLGRRIAKHGSAQEGTPTGLTVFSWDGPRLIEQRQEHGDGSADLLVWDYEPGSFRPSTQRSRRIGAGTTGADSGQDLIDEAFYAIVTDLVGTPSELVDPAGGVRWQRTSTLWGRSASASPSGTGVDCPLRFPGQYYDDETGLHYNLHRYYDPDTAGYLTPDPLGLAPSPNDHAYAPNPLTHFDPLGLSCVEIKKSENSISISHHDSGSGVIADLDENGNLTLMMDNYPKKGSPLRGKDMFADVMDHFGDRVKSIQGYWRYGDNLAAFNEAVANGTSMRDAARGTWTGLRAAEHGFTRVKIVQDEADLNGFTVVSAVFRRE